MLQPNEVIVYTDAHDERHLLSRTPVDRLAGKKLILLSHLDEHRPLEVEQGVDRETGQ